MYKDGSKVDLEYIQMLFANDRFSDLLDKMWELVIKEKRAEYRNYDYLHYVVMSLTELGNYRTAMRTSRKMIAEFAGDYRCAWDCGRIIVAYSYDKVGSKGYKAWCNRALRRFLQAYELNDKDVSLCIEIALVYKNLKDFDSALVWFDKAIKLDDSYSRSYYLKADLLQDCKKYDEAIEVYETVAKRLPWEISSVHYNIGNVLLAKSDTKGAAENFKKAYELDPMDYSAVINLIDCYRELGDDEKVISTCEKLVEADSGCRGYAYEQVASYLLSKGRVEDALQWYDKYFEVSQSDDYSTILACRTLGLVWQSLENNEKTYEYVQKALPIMDKFLKEYPEYTDKNSNIWMDLMCLSAHCEYLFKNYKKAITVYKKALWYYEFYKTQVIEDRRKVPAAQINTRIAILYMFLRDVENCEKYLNIDPESQQNEWCWYIPKVELAYIKGDKALAVDYVKKIVDGNSSCEDFDLSEFEEWDFTKDSDILELVKVKK